MSVPRLFLRALRRNALDALAFLGLCALIAVAVAVPVLVAFLPAMLVSGPLGAIGTAVLAVVEIVLLFTVLDVLDMR